MKLRAALILALLLAVPKTGYSEWNVLPKEAPRLVATRWRDSSLKIADQTLFRQKEGLFEPYFSTSPVFHHADFCQDLLELEQVFPLSRMTSDVYITPEQGEVLIRMGGKIDYSAFRFYNLLKNATTEELKGQVLDARKGDVYLPLLPMNTSETLLKPEASLWSISGQVTTTHKRMDRSRLAWQYDEEFKDVAFDREKYKFAFELGRAVNNSPGAVKGLYTLVSAALLGMVNEIFAYGGNLNDAYVTVHALGKAQAKLFKLPKIPGTNKPIFEVFANAGHHNEVLIAHLPDLLKGLPPDQFSKLIHDIMVTSNNKLDWFGAAETIFSVNDSWRQDLDFVSPLSATKTHPIMLRNLTPTPGWFMAKVLQRHGMAISDPEGPRISRLLSETHQLDVDLRSDLIADEDIVPTQELSKYKLFGISNLDPEIAKKNPDYTLLVLMASYMYYERLLLKNYPMQTAALLSQTNFAITASNDNVIRQASAIPGAQAIAFPFTDYRIMIETGGGKIDMKPEARLSVRPGFVFAASTVPSLLARRPDLVRLAKNALRKSNSQILYHLSRPVGF